jgi:transposase
MTRVTGAPEAAPPSCEPTVRCPACGGVIPLSSGWGPVGDKRFLCARCGEVTDLTIRI